MGVLFALLAAWREIALVPAEGRAGFICGSVFALRRLGDCRVTSLLAMTGRRGPGPTRSNPSTLLPIYSSTGRSASPGFLLDGLPRAGMIYGQLNRRDHMTIKQPQTPKNRKGTEIVNRPKYPASEVVYPSSSVSSVPLGCEIRAGHVAAAPNKPDRGGPDARHCGLGISERQRRAICQRRAKQSQSRYMLCSRSSRGTIYRTCVHASEKQSQSARPGAAIARLGIADWGFEIRFTRYEIRTGDVAGAPNKPNLLLLATSLAALARGEAAASRGWR
jgi:hypothetical protein